ncbi:MAG: adenosylcobinamide-phosphate synthase CbiB [Candidatus Omnitrophota bacterium]
MRGSGNFVFCPNLFIMVMFLIIGSYMADLIFGDPETLPHPVRAMGKLITVLDNFLNRRTSHRAYQKIKGIMLFFVVTGTSAFSAYFFMKLSSRINPLLGNLMWIYLGYTAISVKDLKVKAEAILSPVEKEDLFAARRELSKIVGRDTRALDKEGVIRAAIESVAENTSDGIVAPIFYLVLGGPITAIVYKSINTLDSMVGYRNEKYIDFGWFSAKADDFVNYIPARITGFLIAIAALPRAKRFIAAFKIMVRDGRKHLSPNSAFPEAAVAGVLGIRLGGTSFYGGKIVMKPYIGEDTVKIEPFMIKEAVNISFIVSLLTVSIGVILRWLV